jgi:hypothetical protein
MKEGDDNMKQKPKTLEATLKHYPVPPPPPKSPLVRSQIKPIARTIARTHRIR